MNSPDATILHPADDYHEEYGTVLWWRFVGRYYAEGPWAGSNQQGDFDRGDQVAGPLAMSDHDLVLLELRCFSGDKERRQHAESLCLFIPHWTHFSHINPVRFPDEV